MKYALITIAALLSACSQGPAFECPNKAGDLNYNGIVDASDAAIILDLSLGHTSVNDCQLIAADLDGDGAITEADAQIAFQKAMDE